MDRIYTPAEISNLLRTSKSLVYKLVSQGELGAIRFGRTVRIRQEDLEIFLARHAPTEEPYLPAPQQLPPDRRLKTQSSEGSAATS